MKIIIDEVNEIILNKDMTGEYILELSDFDENTVELGFDETMLELLYFKLKKEFEKKK